MQLQAAAAVSLCVPRDHGVWPECCDALGAQLNTTVKRADHAQHLINALNTSARFNRIVRLTLAFLWQP